MSLELIASDATNLAGQETGRDTLSHSKISVLLNCPRKYELHYEERLAPISESLPLELGKAFQKGIEHQDPDVAAMYLEGWRLRDTPAGPEWQPPAPEDRFMPLSQEAEDNHRIKMATVKGAAAAYLKRWPEGPGESREVEYRVRLRNPWTGAYSQTFDLLGYADGVVDPIDPRIRTTGQIIDNVVDPLELIENKLVGRVDALKVQRLPIDQQVRLARYGLWRATGRPVLRVSYRWVKKPSIKQRAGRKKDRSDAETIDEFLKRLEADYEERALDFYTVEEEPTFAPVADLLRTEAELWMIAARLREQKRAKLAERNTTRCTDFGGCQFLPICTGDPDARALYRVREVRELDRVTPAEASTE